MRIAVVTGASSGMGREFVKAVEREFALDEIWVIARRKERLESLREECRTAIRPLAWDLSDPASLDAYRDLLKTEQPEIRILVNAAGYGVFGAFENEDLENQLGIVDLNDRALTAMCALSLPCLSEGSAIVLLLLN